MLGIDLGRAAIKLVMMRRHRRGWRLESYAVRPVSGDAKDGSLSDPVALREALAAALAQLPVKVRDAALAMNSAEVVTRTIRLEPGLTDQDIENRIAAEAALHLPFALPDVSMDFCRLPAGMAASAPGEDVMLVACRRDSVQQRVRLLTELGIRPVVVDLDALALHRMTSAVSPGAPQVVVDLGAGGFRLHAFAGGRLLYSRAHQLAPSAESKQGPGQLPRLIQEVKRAFQLFLISTACKEPISIDLTGGLALSPGLVSDISKTSGRPVRLIGPPLDVTTHDRIKLSQWRALAPQLSLACALAMRTG